jgi:hypothetical protein
MSLAVDDERISLVEADSVGSSAAIEPTNHHNDQRVGDDIYTTGDADVKYSAQYLVSILKPVKLKPRSTSFDSFCSAALTIPPGLPDYGSRCHDHSHI